jgi:ferrochelatase
MKGMIIRSAAAIPPRAGFALGLPPEKVMMTFQSRFGREPWLTPYTDETLKMRREGVKHIQVMSRAFRRLPGNAGRDRGAEPGNLPRSGWSEYEYIPALNDSPRISK